MVIFHSLPEKTIIINHFKHASIIYDYIYKKWMYSFSIRIWFDTQAGRDGWDGRELPAGPYERHET